ncbi:unnamed protein product [Thlaspi arvense]|uniref:Uncharacterized protein n=1 Tax=Thlaspi arvense TaxID=13288 RepID=A0AAU9S1H8_THLAR|nr:unnamed protein product [Thlaspi arvense]
MEEAKELYKLQREERKSQRKVGFKREILENPGPKGKREPMKESSLKRKAESDPAEETEESGDEMDDVDNRPPWWNPPEWGYDSYDEAEYHSEERTLFDDPEREREWCRCKHQLFDSKGFYVEPALMQVCRNSRVIPVTDFEAKAGHGQTNRELFTDMVSVCLQRYNQEKGLNVEFVEVVRALYSRGPRWQSYITFQAREKPDGPLVPYQAKVLSGFSKGQHFPILCRPEKPSCWFGVCMQGMHMMMEFVKVHPIVR